MKPEIEQCHKKDYFRDEGMLFVRTEGILHTMIKASLLIAGLIVVGLAMPIQNSFGLTRSLDLIVYPDGSTHVTSEIEVDVQQPDFQIDLFGSTIDNFVAIGENGFLLESEVMVDSATIHTFGSSSVLVEYDIHDLISKEGRIWSFKINAPSDYSLLLPENTVIVGMSNLPQNMEIFDDKSKLFLPAGQSQIDYIFGASQTTTPDPTPITPDPISTTNENPNNDLILVGVVTVVAGIVGIVFVIMNKRKSSKPPEINVQDTLNSRSTLVPETIFKLRPELREDDKDIVSFIFENGGNVKESELRKKFLQPRTTMWRAVKRLERHGIVEIEKKDQQNLVILKDNLEEEQ